AVLALQEAANGLEELTTHGLPLFSVFRTAIAGRGRAALFGASGGGKVPGTIRGRAKGSESVPERRPSRGWSSLRWPGHPIGLQIASAAIQSGPWLCVPVLRRVCRFEDEEVERFSVSPRGDRCCQVPRASRKPLVTKH